VVHNVVGVLLVCRKEVAMSISATLMLFALLPLPLLLGAVLGWAGRAWWWAAAAGVVLFNVAAIAAPIEDGQPRVALDDVVFLLTCSVIIVGIALLGAWAGHWSGRVARRRRAASVTSG